MEGEPWVLDLLWNPEALWSPWELLGAMGRAILGKWVEWVGLSTPAKPTPRNGQVRPPYFPTPHLPTPPLYRLYSLLDPSSVSPYTLLVSPCPGYLFFAWILSWVSTVTFIQQTLNGHLLCYEQSTGVLERSEMCLIPLWIEAVRESILIIFHLSLVPAGLYTRSARGWYTVEAQ